MIKIVPKQNRASFNKLWGKYQMSNSDYDKEASSYNHDFCFYIFKKYTENFRLLNG